MSTGKTASKLLHLAEQDLESSYIAATNEIAGTNETVKAKTYALQSIASTLLAIAKLQDKRNDIAVMQYDLLLRRRP